MNEKIVPAKPGDGKAIIALERRCFPAEDVFNFIQIKRLLRSQSCEIFVIRNNGNIVASIIGLFRNFRIPSGRIYKIAVDDSMRGKGIGSRLLSWMEKRCLKKKIHKCCAETRLSNHASRKLFEKNGYQAKKVLPRYYPNGEDGVKLWKNL